MACLGLFQEGLCRPLDPSYFDPYRAQRLTEHAITRYLLENIFISKIEGFTSDDLKYAATAIKNGRVRYDNDMSIQWLPDLEYYTDDDFSNKISTLAAPILGTSTVVLFYVFMYQLVAEKETKLRQSLHTIGMLDSAYWLSNIVIGVALSALLSVLVNVAGLLSKATYWINSPWIINFVIIWLLYFGAVSFSFVMASLLHHAQAVGFTAFFDGDSISWAGSYDKHAPGDVPRKRRVLGVLAVLPYACLSSHVSYLAQNCSVCPK